MGGSSYSDDHYTARVADRAARGVPTFDHTAKVRSGVVAAATHNNLSPKGVIRESRDSVAHPLSVPIGVLFDVTGSMASVPVTLQQKIPNLMSLLLRKAYIQDPQILFGAIGDYFSDRAPLQVGQFESGIEMDDDLTKVLLEGGGGGTQQESYQNAFYFFARKTVSDAWEKRGRKGYLFVIGDEQAYPQSKKAEIFSIFGDEVQSDISTEALIAECQERYNIFFLTPGHTSYGHKFKDYWGKLLGPQNVISLEEADAVCETIGVAIGLVEGTTDLHTMGDDLASAGATASVTTAVTTGLTDLAKSTSLAVAGSGALPESLAKSDKTSRI